MRASDEGAGAAEGGEVDSTNVEFFRQSLIKGWGSGGIASDSGPAVGEHARTVKPSEVRAGDVLLAHPAAFFETGDGGPNIGPDRVGLRRRLQQDGSTMQLRALPAVLLTRVEDSGEAEGVWLSMRTGSLMGDYCDYFHARPLLYGGPAGGGLTIVHPYQQVENSTPLSDVGLYATSDVAKCLDWVEEGEGSSLRFRFFVGQVSWEAGELAAEIGGAGIPQVSRCWLPVRCSADLVLSETGSIDEKPLWLRIAELAGGEVEEVARKFGCMDDDDD